MQPPRFLPARTRAADAHRAVRLAFDAIETPAKRPIAGAALRDFESRAICDLDPRRGASLIAPYTQLGDLDAAYSLANQTLDQFPTTGSLGIWRALWASETLPFRQDERFQALAGR